MNRIALALLGVVMGFSVAPSEARELPSKIDKALYCGHVYLEAARVIAADGDPASGRIIRERGKLWLTYTYRNVPGYTRSELNALKPKYAAEAKADVAAKRYRHNDCGSLNSLQE